MKWAQVSGVRVSRETGQTLSHCRAVGSLGEAVSGLMLTEGLDSQGAEQWEAGHRRWALGTQGNGRFPDVAWKMSTRHPVCGDL